MGHIVESAGAVVGCKVLPIFDENGDSAVIKKIVHRIDRKKAVARVKELLKWAAQAKPHTVGGKKWKKVLSFQNREATKDQQQPNDDMSSNSSKLSFKWDVGSCSSTSSVYSPLSFSSAPVKTDLMSTRNMSRLSSISPQSSGFDANLLCSSPKSDEHVRIGQWITTDSDFVVLEL